MARNDAKTVKLFGYLRESTLSVILGPNINNILLKVRVFFLFVDFVIFVSRLCIMGNTITRNIAKIRPRNAHMNSTTAYIYELCFFCR